MLICVSLTGVAWLIQSLRFIDLIVNRGLNVGTFFYLSALILPSLLWIIIPISLFISVLVALHRLSMDSELIVLRNAGLDSKSLVMTVVYFAGGVMLLSYIIGLYLLPASYREFKDMQSFVRDNYASLLLQEGVFASPTNELTVYIRERDSDGTLYGMMVHDSREEGKSITMMAESGRLVESNTGPRFLLENGNRQEIDTGHGELSLLYFDRYALELSLLNKDINHRRWREPEERYINELFYPKDTEERFLQKLRAEGHYRLMWPFFNVVLALIAIVPFLVGPYNRRGYSLPIILSVAVGIWFVIWGITLNGLMAKSAAMTPLLYLTVILGVGVTSYLLINESRIVERIVVDLWRRCKAKVGCS